MGVFPIIRYQDFTQVRKLTQSDAEVIFGHT